MIATTTEKPIIEKELSAQEHAIKSGKKILHGMVTDRVLRMYDAIRAYGSPRVALKRTVYFTKSFKTSLIVLACLLFNSQTLKAQQPTQQAPPPAIPDTSKMTYNQISNGLKLYVFPAKNQTKEQQKTDEFECYKWAMQQSGIDPLNLPKVQAAPAETGPTGAAVGGAAKGAAAGVAIGAIAGDAGKGAAIGAVAGGLAGRKAGKQQQAQKNQQSQAAAAKSEQDMKDSFIKGFSACLEGKGYTIK